MKGHSEKDTARRQASQGNRGRGILKKKDGCGRGKRQRGQLGGEGR